MASLDMWYSVSLYIDSCSKWDDNHSMPKVWITFSRMRCIYKQGARLYAGTVAISFELSLLNSAVLSKVTGWSRSSPIDAGFSLASGQWPILYCVRRTKATSVERGRRSEQIATQRPALAAPLLRSKSFVYTIETTVSGSTRQRAVVFSF